MTLLKQAIELKYSTLRDKSVDALLMDGHIARVYAKFYDVIRTRSNEQNTVTPGDEESKLELLVKGSRSVCGVLAYLLGDWLIYSSAGGSAPQDGGRTGRGTGGSVR